ncbi:MAG: limonene-1,2-epoxide hydrolase family protein [Actinomycetota bacterium]
MTAEEIVNAFIGALERKDLDAATTYVADGLLYENIGMSKTETASAMREMLEPFVGNYDEVEWVIHHQLASDSVVMNERTDRFRTGETWIEIHLMGVFVVVDGKITEWRDFFDVPAAVAAMSGQG